MWLCLALQSLLKIETLEGGFVKSQLRGKVVPHCRRDGRSLNHAGFQGDHASLFATSACPTEAYIPFHC